MKLGHLVLKSNVLLAPLEGVSDCGFRSLCFQTGAGLTFTEMVRASALKRQNKATLDLIDSHDSTTLTGIQLMAKSSEELIGALGVLERLAFADSENVGMPTSAAATDKLLVGNGNAYAHFQNLCCVDLNLGCPSPEIINIGAGPALLKRKQRLTSMFRSLVEWKNKTRLPNIKAVGCKIRLGLNASEMTSKIYMNAVHAANEAGLDYLTVHARHAKQKSSDVPFWDAIGDIKAVARMPVIGNGNIVTSADMSRIHKLTNCDGFMIARQAIRNPWIFAHYHEEGIAENGDDGNQFDTRSWPSIEQVNAARQNYIECVARYSSKDKYIHFHTNNFARLEQAARSRNYSGRVASPKTIHL
jgi:tRNA-dihydrouridine synthase B